MSSDEQLNAYKAQFQPHRGKMELTDAETALATEELEENQVLWEGWRTQASHQLVQNLGLIGHHTESCNWYYYHELAKQIRRLKPVIIHRNRVVHIFKIVRCYVAPPHHCVDEEFGQHAASNAHLARHMGNLNIDITVDVLHLVCTEKVEDHVKMEHEEKRRKEYDVPSFPPSSPSPSPSRASSVPASPHRVSSGTGIAGSLVSPSARPTRKRKVAAHVMTPQEKMDKFAVPPEYVDWPITRRELELRKSLYKCAMLTGSMYDMRVNGNGYPDTFVFEDPQDPGGYYIQNDPTMLMPFPETLVHNQAFLWHKTRTTMESGAVQYEWPDHTKHSHAEWEEKAMRGQYQHLHEAHCLDVWCMHPTRRDRSTSSIKITMKKYKQTDVYSEQRITVQTQFHGAHLPITVLFLALGIGLDEIVPLLQKIAREHWYAKAFGMLLERLMARHPNTLHTQHDALMYIASAQTDKTNDVSDESRIKYCAGFLSTELFPHVGLSCAFLKEKAVLLGFLVWRLLMKSVGFIPYDQKDDYRYKSRYETNGMMFAALQRQLQQRIGQHMDVTLRNALQEQIPFDMTAALGESKWTELVQRCMLTGNWSTRKQRKHVSRKNVTMTVREMNLFTQMNVCNRSQTTNSAQRKSPSARQACAYQAGFADFNDTPDGGRIGMVSAKPVGAMVTTGTSMKILIQLMRRLIPSHLLQPVRTYYFSEKENHHKDEEDEEKDFDPSERHLQRKASWQGKSFSEKNKDNVGRIITVDGSPIWFTPDASCTMRHLLHLRDKGVIGEHVSFDINQNLFEIRCMPGRMVRPLLNLRAWVRLVRRFREKKETDLAERFQCWDYLTCMEYGLVDWSDALEGQSYVVAFDWSDFLRRSQLGERFTHLYWDASWLKSLTAGSLPFSDMNSSPRSVLACSMTKSAFSNIINPFRMILNQYMLLYEQRAMCRTRIFDDFGLQNISMGHQATLVVTNDPRNQEDAWSINQHSLQRGLSAAMKIETYSHRTSQFGVPSSEKENEDISSSSNPLDNSLVSEANTSKLNDLGFAPIGTHLEVGDVVIGKRRGNKWVAVNESCIIMRVEDEGTVMAVSVVGGGTGEDGKTSKTTIRVRVGSFLCTCMGDKYCTIHGQKGVTGITLPMWKFPFSCVDGKVADVMMNIIGICARLTAGHMRELLMSKAAVCTGQYVDATAFPTLSIKQQREAVHAAFVEQGAHPLGLEMHYSGETGEPLRPLFVGSINWMKLLHLVSTKAYSRAMGPRQVLTRQPTEGRSRDGGLRFGEMEVMTGISWGASGFLLERVKTTSDPFTMFICRRCGLRCESNLSQQYAFCRVCFSSLHLDPVNSTYAVKLCNDYLTGLHVFPKTTTTDENHPVTYIRPLEDRVDQYRSFSSLSGSSSLSSSSSSASASNEVASLSRSMLPFALIPRPEDFEFAAQNITRPVLLRDKLQQLPSLHATMLAIKHGEAALSAYPSPPAPVFLTPAAKKPAGSGSAKRPKK